MSDSWRNNKTANDIFLQQAKRLRESEARLDEALKYIEHLLQDSRSLRRRRSVRVALALAYLVKPAINWWRKIKKFLRGRASSSDDGSNAHLEHQTPGSIVDAAERLMAEGLWAEALEAWNVAARDNPLEGEHAVAYRRGIAITSLLSGAYRALPAFSELAAKNGLRGAPLLEAEATHSKIVFSAITGNSDGSWYPGWVHPEFHYVRFADQDISTYTVLEARQLEYIGSSPRRSARWVKTHPHALFPSTRWAIWMDGNVLAADDWNGLFEEFMESGAPIGLIRHPLRNTIEQEASACIALGKEHADILINQYRDIGPDPGVGLFETNLVMYDLEHPELKPLLDLWWSLIDSGSTRDQVALPVALSRLGIRPHITLANGASLRSDYRFFLVPHESAAWGKARREMEQRHSAAPTSFETNRKRWTDAKTSRIDAQRSRQIDVIVPVHNAAQDVQACLESVIASRDSSKHRIVIVDDGSAETTRSLIHNLSELEDNFIVLRSPTATGFTRAANRGLVATNAEMIVVLNSDTIVASNWLYKLAEALYQSPYVGIVGPMSNAAGTQSWPLYQVDSLEEQSGQSVVNSLPCDLTIEQVDVLFEATAALRPVRSALVHGFCFALRRETVNQVGLFDEQMFPEGYGEEVDYCLRAVDAGWTLGWATNTYVWHRKSASYTPQRRTALVEHAMQRLSERYGSARLREAVAASLALRESLMLPDYSTNRREVVD